MRLLFALVILNFLNCFTTWGQTILEKPEKSEFYLQMLANSKDSLYVQILEKFDKYLLENPLDADVRIEKCRVIENAYYDAFGRYRLMMVFRTPIKGWSAADILKLLLFTLVIVLFLILPYLWILPLHHISDRFKFYSESSLLNARWGLREFWLLCSAIMILQFMGLFIFYYEDLVSSWFNDLNGEEAIKISLNLANFSFGLIAGYIVKRSKSLTPSIIFHITNNLFATILKQPKHMLMLHIIPIIAVQYK